MRSSTVYFIGSFIMFLMLIGNLMWNREDSSQVLCFLHGVAFGWGIISGTVMRSEGD